MKSARHAGLLTCLLAALLAGPATGQQTLTTPETLNPLPPGSCAELADAQARLDCLKTRIQRRETAAVPDLLAFLETSPQTAEPPLDWLPAFAQPWLLKQIPGWLQAQNQPVLRQHLLLLIQAALQSPGVDAATTAALLTAARAYVDYPHLLTRLQARDIGLLRPQADAPARLRQLLDSPQPNERALGLVHYGRWLADPQLKKSLPPLPPERFLAWTQQPDQSLAELARWTLHPIFRPLGAAASFHGFLGRWLASEKADTVPLGENALLLLLHHPRPELRAYAVGRLALTGNPAYAARLEALFDDPDADVRLKAQAGLTQLQKLVPLQQLASLKDPRHLPPDTAERIRALMRDPNYRAQLLTPAYRHLAAQPVFGEELWTLLQTSRDPRLLLPGLAALDAVPGWAPSRLAPLLEPGQEVHVRAQALALALKRPYSPALGELLRPLLRDGQIELPLQILDYLFRIGATRDARNLLYLLLPRADQRVDRSLLPFDGGLGTANLDAYVAERLEGWIRAQDARGRTLADWLGWIRDADLPTAWRRRILRLIGNQGRSPELLPILRQLMQDTAVALDAESALNAVESRLRP